MGDRGSTDRGIRADGGIVESRPEAAGPLAPEDLQTRLARAYLSGDGAEVERVLALIAEANYTLPPKTASAA
jgi:hypothetical protein